MLSFFFVAFDLFALFSLLFVLLLEKRFVFCNFVDLNLEIDSMA